VELHRP